MAKPGHRYPTRDQLLLPGFETMLLAPEWDVALETVQSSFEGEPAAWEAFRDCLAVEVYTDGSAPVRNPGGRAGFAAVVVGFSERLDADNPLRPQPCARLDLGGYVAARKSDPATSNNRAEIGGVLAALEALRRLGELGAVPQQTTIWSDSQYVIFCATGKWQRKKNTDLWPIHDRLAREARLTLPGGFTLQWVRGHAGNEYNEAADVLASRAAFDFDETLYARFRAAQIATGREMPGESTLARGGVASEESTEGNVKTLDGQNEADYTLILNTKLDAGGRKDVGRAPATGTYRLTSKDGRSREGSVQHKGERAPDEAEYLTLISALGEIVGRIAGAGHEPRDYALTVYSNRELMVKQLLGEYRVKAPSLQYPYAEASSLLKRFKSAQVVWKRGNEIERMLKDA